MYGKNLAMWPCQGKRSCMSKWINVGWNSIVAIVHSVQLNNKYMERMGNENVRSESDNEEF